MEIRKDRLTLLVLILFSLTFGIVVSAVNSNHPKFLTAESLNAPYGIQRERNAEWVGPVVDSGSTFMQNLSQNVSYVVVENPLGRPGFQQHFASVANLVSSGSAHGNNMRVFEYYNSTIWYTNSAVSWTPYATTFKSSWYLNDNAGKPIAFMPFGVMRGYLIDVSNPEYRAWAVSTIADWMARAPYKGVALDSADKLVGSAIRPAFGNRNVSLNTLLCGSGSAGDANGNCAQVVAWNNGLTALLQQITQKLHSLGDEVAYNGIAPSPVREPDRNLSLINNTDMAANESFCYDVTPGASTSLTYEPLTADIDMMRTQAAAGKKIMQITNNLGAANKQALAPYCLAGFLMGWQPGYDYWVYHKDYNSAATGAYPETPEQNLNLGHPISAAYTQTGAVLSRSFQNGFVAVNTGDGTGSVQLPTKLIQFSGGNQGNTFPTGSTISLAPRSGMFFLNDSYVNKAVNPPPPGNGANGGTNGGTPPAQPVALAPPAGAKMQSNKPLTNKVSGRLELRATSEGNILKVEYYLNGKLVHRTTTFPSTWSLDTTRLANGTYKLLIKYYKTDGSTTSNTKDITVSNKLTLTEKLSAARREYGLPTMLVFAAVLASIFLIHRLELFRPKWLYVPTPPSDASTQAIVLVSSVLPPEAQAPGTLIKPNSGASQPRDNYTLPDK